MVMVKSSKWDALKLILKDNLLKQAQILLSHEHKSGLTHQPAEVSAPPEEGAAATALTERIHTHHAEVTADSHKASEDS